MNPTLTGLLCGVLFSFVGVRLMNVRWRHRPNARWQGRTMVLEPPPIRRRSAFVIIGLFPVIVATIIARTEGPVYWPIVCFGFAVFGFAAWATWAIGGRDLAIDTEAIEFRGIWGRRLAWTEIEKVEAFALPKRSFVVFTGKNGKVIAVDSTLYGWEEFLKKVTELGRAAGPSLARAVSRVEGT